MIETQIIKRWSFVVRERETFEKPNPTALLSLRENCDVGKEPVKGNEKGQNVAQRPT